MENPTGFLPNQINLNEMKDISIKIILLGDGMSGKTQILLTFGKKILYFLNEIYMQKDNSYLRNNIFNNTENKEKEIQDETNTLSVDFLNWVNFYGFLIEYGDSMWDLTSISLQTETIGIEDFQFIFPFFWNNKTFKITLNGNDLGGQNIFDHFRAVLGKIALPGDNMIAVFDKSRRLSCCNSIEHIKEVMGEFSSNKEWRNRDAVQFWSVGNKTDLEKHINTRHWREGIIDSLVDRIRTFSYFRIPSLLDERGEEKSIYFTIKDNKITFPDLEALLYNAIRYSDNKYLTPLMSDVNSRALAREIAAQLIYQQNIEEIEQDKNFPKKQWWEDFKSSIFKQRPLALQYLRGLSAFQKHETNDDSYERIRLNWISYEADFPIIHEELVKAIKSAGNAQEILKKMPGNFSTNAIIGTGVLELFNAIIAKAILTSEDPESKIRQKSIGNWIKKF